MVQFLLLLDCTLVGMAVAACGEAINFGFVCRNPAAKYDRLLVRISSQT